VHVVHLAARVREAAPQLQDRGGELPAEQGFSVRARGEVASLVVRGHRAVDTSEEQVEGPGAESTVVNAPAKLLLELEDSAAGTVGAVDERVYAKQQRRAGQ